ncbi:uncharacterized protein LOC143357452 [Halictus rubicundus]|uniref:uncharacterized protein LOC143357452 n=1 Tax=Halictus rubicundus TaxID=77578 RepID=UPI004035BDFC
MMENVYVIKVKTKPPMSSLYPSERRYSASTVGGLSFVHFGLGALSLLLGSLALSLQGPILSAACLVPFVTGVLAWRRWYIDRNIAIFFYGSLFSLVAAILCFVATVFDMAPAAKVPDTWPINGIFERYPNRFPETTMLDEETFNVTDAYDQLPNISTNIPTPGIVIDNMSNISGYILRASTIDPSDSSEVTGNSTESPPQTSSRENVETGNFIGGSLLSINNSVMSFCRRNYQENSHTRTLLTVNVLVAALLEAFWSALSARIALRGMMNRLPEASYPGGVAGQGNSSSSGLGKRKPPAPRPDILDHDSRRFSESLQNLSALHDLRNSGPRLPLPESSREFRERVERFLANQAAHRIVEGACSRKEPVDVSTEMKELSGNVVVDK